MKRFIRIVLTIQFALMLTHCATSTDDLYREYAACRNETLHVKITEAGVVMVHPDGSPMMVYKTGACPDEMAKWEKSHALKEKRRREREAYDAAAAACGQGLTLWCVQYGPGDKRCSCIDNAELKHIYNGRGGYY